MNYEQMNNNRLRLIGTVEEEPVYTHEVLGEGFYETVLSVPRLSQQRDLIPVTVSDRLIEGEKLVPGMRIGISGQFRSHNKLEGGRSRLLLTAFAREFFEPEEGECPNSIEICGYVCKQPVYRTTPFKREICDVLLAVNRAYGKSDYIPCILWGRNARFARGLGVGAKISVGGRIQSRVYVKAIDGERSEERTAYEVSVSKITLEEGVGCGLGASV